MSSVLPTERERFGKGLLIADQRPAVVKRLGLIHVRGTSLISVAFLRHKEVLKV